MFHVDNNSAVPVMPAVKPVVSAATSYFTEGGNGVPPTYPGPDWFNIVQSELLAILAAAGITPDKANNVQLLAAMRALFLDTSQNGADIQNKALFLQNLGLGDDARLSGNLTVKGGVWDTAPGDTPERVWSPNNKPSLTTLGVLDATTTQKGIVELATNTEMATGTSPSLVPTVAAVMSLFSKRSFSANDYVRIPDVPGGLIIQWVSGNAGANGVFFAPLPVPFPNKLLFAGAIEADSASWGDNSVTAWGVDFKNSSLTQIISYARRVYVSSIVPETAKGLVIAIGN